MRPGGRRSSARLRATTRSSSLPRASALDAPCRRVSRSWLEFPTKRGGDVNPVMTRVTRIRLLAACAAAALTAAPRPSFAQQAGTASGPAALNTLTAAQRSAGWRLPFDRKTTAGRRREAGRPMEPGAPRGEGKARRALAQRREDGRVRVRESRLDDESQGEQVRQSPALRA